MRGTKLLLCGALIAVFTASTSSGYAASSGTVIDPNSNPTSASTTTPTNSAGGTPTTSTNQNDTVTATSINEAVTSNGNVTSSYAGLKLAANATNVTVDIHHDNYPQYCRVLNNTTSKSFFVPARSLPEWQAFLQHIPTNTSAIGCPGMCGTAQNVSTTTQPPDTALCAHGTVQWVTNPTTTPGTATFIWNCLGTTGGGVTGTTAQKCMAPYGGAPVTYAWGNWGACTPAAVTNKACPIQIVGELGSGNVDVSAGCTSGNSSQQTRQCVGSDGSIDATNTKCGSGSSTQSCTPVTYAWGAFGACSVQSMVSSKGYSGIVPAGTVGSYLSYVQSRQCVGSDGSIDTTNTMCGVGGTTTGCAMGGPGLGTYCHADAINPKNYDEYQRWISPSPAVQALLLVYGYPNVPAQTNCVFQTASGSICYPGPQACTPGAVCTTTFYNCPSASTDCSSVNNAPPSTANCTVLLSTTTTN